MTQSETSNKGRDFLSTIGVEEEFLIPAGTLRYWRHMGIGPASFKMGAKRVMYRRSELERWIAEQEATTSRGGDVA